MGSRRAIPGALRWIIGLFLGSAPLAGLPAEAPSTASVPESIHAQNPVDFNQSIRPILSSHCFPCHGPDAGRRKARLRLDSRQSTLERRAIIPGEPDPSALIQRIESDDPDERMPPPETHKSLTDTEKSLLRRWITEGAAYQEHWSFEPPARPDAPSGSQGIDVLVRLRLDQLGLTAAPEADRRTLIRRLCFDVLGLLPTPSETDAFVRDRSPDAFERLVDRALHDPRFGERMAIHWLDVVRFADTIGYHSDNPRNVWPYRDWVIDAFNANKPFDRFTLEQIAGDLLPDANQESRIGSAFNRLVLSTEEGGAQPKDYEARMLADRVRAVGTAWLGLTTGCAQCHDHKYDPLTQRDFYSLGAFFADLRESPIGRREEGMIVLEPGDQARLAALAPDSEARRELLQSRPRCLVSNRAPTNRVVRLLPRGNWMDESGEVLEPALPEFLRSPSYEGRSLDRLDLARWLVSRDNPLTARVVMNRLWKHLFGTGLSRILDDLGSQGEAPTNAPLLDWLACEFMDNGWDLKHMVRTILLSETYRQASSVAEFNPRTLSDPTACTEAVIAFERAIALDPLNREYARQSRFRLDAELIRDGALQVSGLLTSRIGGPSAKPYQPAGYWENLNFPPRDYTADDGASQYRRGLYTWWQRTFLHPSLLAFDAPSREECTAERARSNLPQQALTLLNDPSFLEAYRVLAAAILRSPRSSIDQRVAWAWQRVLQRNPTDPERRAASSLVRQHLDEYRWDPASAHALLGVGYAPNPPGLDPAELAAWTHLARVLFNLHETITRP